jgi:hypothetical protein
MNRKKIALGSNQAKRNNEKNEKFDRTVYPDQCVIHLIDIDDSIVETTAEQVTEYITDQVSELWRDLRDGDLIENINVSGDAMSGVYCVSVDTEQTEAEYIVRNGLNIVDLVWTLDRKALPSDFYAITRFPINYYDIDKMIVNNTYALHLSDCKSYWGTERSDEFDVAAEYCDSYYVPLDVPKLKLDRLTEDNVFYSGNSDDSDNYEGCGMYYIVITYKKTNYLIGSLCKTEEEFLDLLDTDYFEFLSDTDNDIDIDILLQSENVDNENVMIIL